MEVKENNLGTMGSQLAYIVQIGSHLDGSSMKALLFQRSCANLPETIDWEMLI